MRAAAIALAVPLIALAVLLSVPGLDALWMALAFHFYAVSAAALLAAFVCVVLILSARSIRQTRILFLALCFFALGSIFAVHGITTPGHFYHEYTAALVRSPWLSTFVGAIFAALSVVNLPGLNRHARRRTPWAIMGAMIGACVGYVGVSRAFPNWLMAFPTQEKWFQYLLSAVTIALFAFAARRYFQAYLFARLPGQLAVTVGLLFLAEAQLSLVLGEPYYYSWWMYHGLFLMAFLAVLTGWTWEWRRAHDVTAIAETVLMRDALKQLARGRPARLIALANRIECHDFDTSRHVDRVTAYAYAIGREMELKPRRLRDLVLAAQMHDVGKVMLPQPILLNPGKLTPEKYATIQQHPIRGWELVGRVKTMRTVAKVVRHHHERYDGGYPDGLAGEAIPLEARIISVADTFDAITAGRPYQAAKSVEEATAELRRVAGAQFDPQCVESFLRALGSGILVPQIDRALDPAPSVATRAA